MKHTVGTDNALLRKMPFLAANILTKGELREGRLVIVIMIMAAVVVLQSLIFTVMLSNANAATAEAYANQEFFLY